MKLDRSRETRDVQYPPFEIEKFSFMKKKELQRIDMFLFLGNRYRETKKRSVN